MFYHNGKNISSIYVSKQDTTYFITKIKITYVKITHKFTTYIKRSREIDYRLSSFKDR